MVVFKMHSRFFVFSKCSVKCGPKVDVLLIAFLQLGYGWNFEMVHWQILGRSGKRIIVLSSLLWLELSHSNVTRVVSPSFSTWLGSYPSHQKSWLESLTRVESLTRITVSLVIRHLGVT